MAPPAAGSLLDRRRLALIRELELLLKLELDLLEHALDSVLDDTLFRHDLRVPFRGSGRRSKDEDILLAGRHRVAQGGTQHLLQLFLGLCSLFAA
jgi:hypothetical protein